MAKSSATSPLTRFTCPTYGAAPGCVRITLSRPSRPSAPPTSSLPSARSASSTRGSSSATFTAPSARATAVSRPAGPPPLIVAVTRSCSPLSCAPSIAAALIIRPSAAVHTLLAPWISRAACAMPVVSQRKARACPPISVRRSSVPRASLIRSPPPSAAAETPQSESAHPARSAPAASARRTSARRKSPPRAAPLQLVRLVRPLAVQLPKPPVAPIRLAHEERHVHFHRAGRRVIAVLPQVAHIRPLLAEKRIAQHVAQLVRRRHVEEQPAPRPQRRIRRPEERRRVALARQVVHPVARAQHRVHAPPSVRPRMSWRASATRTPARRAFSAARSSIACDRSAPSSHSPCAPGAPSGCPCRTRTPPRA